MLDVTVLALAAALWTRATSDDRFLAGAAHDLLLVAVDADGQECVWVESQPDDATATRSGDPHVRSALRARDQIARHVAEADAIAAGLAFWAPYRIGPPTVRRSGCDASHQFDWLLVLALDDTVASGYLARVRHDGNGRRLVGSREPWPESNRTLFAESDVVRVLEPARTTIANTLRQGLHDAAKHRRRQARQR